MLVSQKKKKKSNLIVCNSQVPDIKALSVHREIDF